MARELTSQKTTTNYAQQQAGSQNSRRTGSGGKASNGTTESSGKQVSAGTSSQVSESVRDLTSRGLRTGTTEEKANIGFEISFKVKITGKIPHLTGRTTNC